MYVAPGPWSSAMVKGELRRVSETATCRSGAPPAGSRHRIEPGVRQWLTSRGSGVTRRVVCCFSAWACCCLILHISSRPCSVLFSHRSASCMVQPDDAAAHRLGGRGTQGGPRSARLARPLESRDWPRTLKVGDNRMMGDGFQLPISIFSRPLAVGLLRLRVLCTDASWFVWLSVDSVYMGPLAIELAATEASHEAGVSRVSTPDTS